TRFFAYDMAQSNIYTLSLHDALPIWQYPAFCLIHLDGFPAQIHNVEKIPQIVRDDDQTIFSNLLTVQQIYSTRRDWLFPCSFLEAKVCPPAFCTHLRKMNLHKSV